MLSLQADVADPAVQAVVDHVSQEHYQSYHLAVENMGLGLYGGKDYDMGFRNRDSYIYDDSEPGDGPTSDDGQRVGDTAFPSWADPERKCPLSFPGW